MKNKELEKDRTDGKIWNRVEKNEKVAHGESVKSFQMLVLETYNTMNLSDGCHYGPVGLTFPASSGTCEMHSSPTSAVSSP